VLHALIRVIASEKTSLRQPVSFDQSTKPAAFQDRKHANARLKIHALSESIDHSTRNWRSKGAIVRQRLLALLLAIFFSGAGFIQPAQAKSAATFGKQFPWLISYVGKTGDELVADQRFNTLLATVVPDQKVYLVGKQTSLRATTKKMLSDAPAFVIFKHNRYVVFSGEDKHQKEDKIMMWLDWKSNSSALAIVHHYGPDDPKQFRKEPMLYVVSEGIVPPEPLPEDLKFMIKNWLLIEGVTPSALTYNGKSASAALIF